MAMDMVTHNLQNILNLMVTETHNFQNILKP